MTYRLRNTEFSRPFSGPIIAGVVGYFGYAICLSLPQLWIGDGVELGQFVAFGLFIGFMGLIFIVGLYLLAGTVIAGGLMLLALAAVGVHQRLLFTLAGGLLGFLAAAAFVLATTAADRSSFTGLLLQASFGVPPGLVSGLLLHLAGGVRRARPT